MVVLLDVFGDATATDDLEVNETLRKLGLLVIAIGMFKKFVAFDAERRSRGEKGDPNAAFSGGMKLRAALSRLIANLAFANEEAQNEIHDLGL